MAISAWLALLGTWALAVAAPGPDFIAVLRLSASQGRRHGLLASLGVVSGMTCWMLLAITGLTVVLAAHAQAYVALRLAGGGFLTAYGLWILWHTRGSSAQPQSQQAPEQSRWASYRLGLTTNLANPKALVFFGALLASLLPAHPSWETRTEVIAAMIGVGLSWFVLVAVLASRPVVVGLYARGRKVIERVLGTVFVGLGALLLEG